MVTVKNRKRISIIFVVCFFLLTLILNFSSTIAFADYHIVDVVPNDRSASRGYFSVVVNITNVSVPAPPFGNDPLSYRLEWEVLRADGMVYLRGVRDGKMYGTLASSSEPFDVLSLSYGYFRYRLVADLHGGVSDTGWVRIEVGKLNGGGGGRARSVGEGLCTA